MFASMKQSYFRYFAQQLIIILMLIVGMQYCSLVLTRRDFRMSGNLYFASQALPLVVRLHFSSGNEVGIHLFEVNTRPGKARRPSGLNIIISSSLVLSPTTTILNLRSSNLHVSTDNLPRRPGIMKLSCVVSLVVLLSSTLASSWFQSAGKQADTVPNGESIFADQEQG